MSEAKKKIFDFPYTKLLRITTKQVSCKVDLSGYHFGSRIADIQRDACAVMQRIDDMLREALINGQ